MESIAQKINQVNDKEDFLAFMELLIKNFKENPNEWENKTLDTYLEAIVSWTGDMDGYYQNQNLPVPTNINWRAFANILMAARIYE